MSSSPAPFSFQTPYIPQGWAGQYYASSILAGFAYDIPDQILYTIYQQQQYDVFLQASLSIAQQLTLAGKQNSAQPSFPLPDMIYNEQIVGVLPQCILCENGAPLLCENGNYLVLSTGETIN